MEQLGERIRRLRVERGMAQDRLALEAHVDQSGLSKFERGRRALSERSVRRIAQILGVGFDELVEGTDFEVRAERRP